MKKYLFLALLGIAVFAVNAQSPVNPGIKIGYASSKISTNISDIETDFYSGFVAGAFVRLNLKKWYLQPEVYYAMKGGELTYDMGQVDPNDPNPAQAVSQKVNLQTIDIPVLLGYKLFDPPLMNLRIHGGPVASLVMNKDIEIKMDGVDLPAGDFEETLKNALWGMQVGAGIDFLVFTLDARYEFGLSNFYDKPENDLGKLEEYKANIFHVSLGWKIIP
ncbi:MAG: PorT family protein [Bacteroidales bacterium]|nr:PorT family protein [Bacteroidales bacterium]